MAMYRVLLTILIIAFAAGVTCAAVCGQQSGERHEDGSRCDECVSTAFESGTKIVDAGFFAIRIGEALDSAVIPVQFVEPFLLLPQLASDSPPSVTASSSTLRI